MKGKDKPQIFMGLQIGPNIIEICYVEFSIKLKLGLPYESTILLLGNICAQGRKTKARKTTHMFFSICRISQFQIFRCEYVNWSNHRNKKLKRDHGIYTHTCSLKKIISLGVTKLHSLVIITQSHRLSSKTPQNQLIVIFYVYGTYIKTVLIWKYWETKAMLISVLSHLFHMYFKITLCISLYP